MNTASARCNTFCPRTFTVGQRIQISLQLNVPSSGDTLTQYDTFGIPQRHIRRVLRFRDRLNGRRQAETVRGVFVSQ